MTSAISHDVAVRLRGDSVVCRQWAEQELGPYHLDRSPFRRDITEDCRGVALVIGLALGALRGTQESNADGLVEFHTIYPGWYPAGPCTST